MNQGRAKRLIELIRNDARLIIQRDKKSVRLVTDMVRKLNLLEVEIGLGANVNVDISTRSTKVQPEKRSNWK